MSGLDTKVLVRYLTQDDPEQSARAGRLIETRCTRETPGRIAVVVLCELVWVLRGAYHYEKRLVVEALGQILLTAELEVENENVASQALAAYREDPADFSDYVIAYANWATACEAAYSFDQKLAKHGRVREP